MTMYPNEVGLVKFTMTACHACAKGDNGCTTPITAFTRKGNVLLCPDHIAVDMEDIIETMYSKKTCDKETCVPNPIDCKMLGCTRCPKKSGDCIAEQTRRAKQYTQDRK